MYRIPNLPYPYDQFEPLIDTTTMRLHHTKHHQAYADGLNNAIKKYRLPWDFDDLVGMLHSYKHIKEIRDFGGGFYNHLLLWESLDQNFPDNSRQKMPNLTSKIEKANKQFFGSGWVWLVKTRDGRIVWKGYQNQDNPIFYGEEPLWGIDLWEHAYYRLHGANKTQYVKNILQVTNWSKVLDKLGFFLTLENV